MKDLSHIRNNKKKIMNPVNVKRICEWYNNIDNFDTEQLNTCPKKRKITYDTSYKKYKTVRINEENSELYIIPKRGDNIYLLDNDLHLIEMNNKHIIRPNIPLLNMDIILN